MSSVFIRPRRTFCRAFAVVVMAELVKAQFHGTLAIRRRDVYCQPQSGPPRRTTSLSAGAAREGGSEEKNIANATVPADEPRDRLHHRFSEINSLDRNFFQSSVRLYFPDVSLPGSSIIRDVTTNEIDDSFSNAKSHGESPRLPAYLRINRHVDRSHEMERGAGNKREWTFAHVNGREAHCRDPKGLLRRTKAPTSKSTIFRHADTQKDGHERRLSRGRDNRDALACESSQS